MTIIVVHSGSYDPTENVVLCASLSLTRVGGSHDRMSAAALVLSMLAEVVLNAAFSFA